MVEDAHQPLHASALYTRELPKGDAGGNGISVLPASGQKVALHPYWDSLFGGYSTVYGAIFDSFDTTGKSRLSSPADKVSILDPDVLVGENAELARSTAYAYPVTPSQPAELTRLYESNAKKVAEERIALAAARPAKLWNAALR